MKNLCIFGTAILFSYLGWTIGSRFGDIMLSFGVSAVASLLGVWVGWKVYQRFFY